MSYKSIDILQRSLASSIFSTKKDAKKAAGRALGTIVEIITYYLLREWGYAPNISIETKLPEFEILKSHTMLNSLYTKLDVKIKRI